jgi:hypothetical protein
MLTEIEPLTREDVIAAVERKNPPRIPLVRAKWWGEGPGGPCACPETSRRVMAEDEDPLKVYKNAYFFTL